AKDPENRFATTTRMVEALRRGLETGEVMEDDVARRRESIPPPSVSRVMQRMGITAPVEPGEPAAQGAAPAPLPPSPRPVSAPPAPAASAPAAPAPAAPAPAAHSAHPTATLGAAPPPSARPASAPSAYASPAHSTTAPSTPVPPGPSAPS